MEIENNKDVFKFLNEFIFLDHSQIGVDVKVIDLRKYIINRFHKTVLQSRILTTLSVIGDIILKLHDKNL